MNPTSKGDEGRLYWFIKSFPGFARVGLAGLASFFVAVWTTDGIAAMITVPMVWWGVAAGLVLATLALGHFTFLSPTYTTLAKREERARGELRDARTALQKTVDMLLMLMLRQLKMDDASTRISAYSVEHDEFVLLSRQSTNPDHEVRGRPSYPLRQGIIGKAWRKDSAIQFSSESSRTEWEAECVATHGFTPLEASSLTMMARSTLAIRLDTPAGEKVGMLVLESEDEDKERFNELTLKRLRNSQVHHLLVNVIAASHAHFPRVRERAGERGRDKNATPQLDEPMWKNPSAL